MAAIHSKVESLELENHRLKVEVSVCVCVCVCVCALLSLVTGNILMICVHNILENIFINIISLQLSLIF